MSSFLTVTYSEEHLPADGSLSREHYKLFLHRLRRSTRYHFDRGLRFFGVGEYGDRTARPHYHFILFGDDFRDDRRRWKESPTGEPMFVSQRLDDVWGKGQCLIGQVTPESARYVSGYVLKKVVGDRADAHYNGREPEFMTCSQGIGRAALDRWRSDFFPNDYAIFRGKPMRVPRYFDKQLPEDELQLLKTKRKQDAMKPERLANSTRTRLAVREEVTKARVNLRKRDVA